MSDWPGSVMPPIISCISRYAIGQHFASFNASFWTNGTWPSANRALYVPFGIPAPFRITRFWYAINSVPTGNVDLGVYAPDGTLIVSCGSTAAAGTGGVLTFITPTATTLPPGSYYMACAFSSASNNLQAGAPSVVMLQSAGVVQAASQVPLATAPTFATPASAYLNLFGISSISGF